MIAIVVLAGAFHADPLAACLADAHARRRGIWAGEFQMPWEWRRSRR